MTCLSLGCQCRWGIAGCPWEGAQGKVCLGRTHHWGNAWARATLECLFANSEVGGWGRLCTRAYLSLSAGFLLFLGPVVGAGRGADLLTWQFDLHMLVFTIVKELPWGWGWGWGGGVNLMVIQVGKRNQNHTTKYKCTQHRWTGWS